jgi:hypothetical protein
MSGRRQGNPDGTLKPERAMGQSKARPNCKIEWDDPTKPKTAEPAVPSSKKSSI